MDDAELARRTAATEVAVLTIAALILKGGEKGAGSVRLCPQLQELREIRLIVMKVSVARVAVRAYSAGFVDVIAEMGGRVGAESDAKVGAIMIVAVVIDGSDLEWSINECWLGEFHENSCDIVTIIKLQNAIVGIDFGFEPVAPRGQTGDIDILTDECLIVDIDPADRDTLVEFAAGAVGPKRKVARERGIVRGRIEKAEARLGALAQNLSDPAFGKDGPQPVDRPSVEVDVVVARVEGETPCGPLVVGAVVAEDALVHALAAVRIGGQNPDDMESTPADVGSAVRKAQQHPIPVGDMVVTQQVALTHDHVGEKIFRFSRLGAGEHSEDENGEKQEAVRGFHRRG